MKQKFELTLTERYASSWGVQEALRELIQNAIDQETQVDGNTLSIGYADNILKISNKDSVLQKKSLLLGFTSKEDDTETIGQFGEGYKIALLVLTRLGHNVTIYNYGKKEVWTSRFVKSRRYEGEKVLTIDVETGYLWTKVPDNNLTIEVDGITEDIYDCLRDRCLLFHDDKGEVLESERGEILLDDRYKGRLYVSGLYINNDDSLEHGYDIKPKYLSIGRDRDLVSSFDVYRTTSNMWIKQDHPRKLELIKKGSNDTTYIPNAWGDTGKLGDEIYESIKEEHGENIVPVSSQTEYEMVTREYVTAKPLLVNDTMKRLLDDSDKMKNVLESMEKNELSKEDKYEQWRKKYLWRTLTDDVLNELDEIMGRKVSW